MGPTKEDNFTPFFEVLVHCLKDEGNLKRRYIKILTNDKKYRTSARTDKNWMQFFILSLPKNKKLRIEICQENNLTNTKLTSFAINCHELIAGLKSFFDEEIDTEFGTLKIQIIPILSRKRMMKVVNKDIIEAIQGSEIDIQNPEYSYYPSPSALETSLTHTKDFNSEDMIYNNYEDEGAYFQYMAPSIQTDEKEEIGIEIEEKYDNENEDKQYNLQSGLDDIYKSFDDSEEEPEEEAITYTPKPRFSGGYIPSETKHFQPLRDGIFFIKNKKLEDLDVYIYPLLHEDYYMPDYTNNFRPIDNYKGAYWHKYTDTAA